MRSRANERLWQRLTIQVAPEQRTRLEQLLVVTETERTSPFDRLRDGPVLQSPAELGRAVERLEEVQSIAAGLPSLDRLPTSRITTLARFANAAKAHAVARLPDERRIATLLAFVRSGASALAPALTAQSRGLGFGQRVGVICSGGNIAPDEFVKILGKPT